MLCTARDWAVPPLVILRGRESREWTVTDRVLAVALTLSKDLLCPGCGQPKHESWNPDSEGYFDVKEADCQACAALDRDSKAHKEHDPARKAWTVNTRPPDEPLRHWLPA